MGTWVMIIATSYKAAFVTRLRPDRLPGKAARQLPDLSTTIWVDPPSTGVTRRRGALHKTGSLNRGILVAEGAQEAECKGVFVEGFECEAGYGFFDSNWVHPAMNTDESSTRQAAKGH